MVALARHAPIVSKSDLVHCRSPLFHRRRHSWRAAAHIFGSQPGGGFTEIGLGAFAVTEALGTAEGDCALALSTLKVPPIARKKTIAVAFTNFTVPTLCLRV